MAAYLKHSKTGAVFPYNENLAKRPDMQVVDEAGSVTIDEAPAAPKPSTKAKPKAKTEPTQSDVLNGLTDEFA